MRCSDQADSRRVARAELVEVGRSQNARGSMQGQPAAYHPSICICTISCTLRSLYSKRQEIPTGLEVSISVPNQDRRGVSSGKELSHQQPGFLTLFPAHCLRGINTTLIRTCHGSKKGNILTCCQNCCRFLRADKRKAELVFVCIKF